MEALSVNLARRTFHALKVLAPPKGFGELYGAPKLKPACRIEGRSTVANGPISLGTQGFSGMLDF